MAYQLATAYIQIVPTMEGMKSNLEKELGGSVNNASESLGKNFGGTFLKAAGAAITAGAAAVGAATTAVWKAANDVASQGDLIDKTSQQIGVSAEQYQALAYAAEHSGFSVSQFNLAARNLESSGFEGNVYDAMNAIMSLDDETQRTQKAIELFGERSAMAMRPFFNGEQNMDDFKTQLAEIGGLMSDEAVKSSATFEDSLTNLNMAFNGLKNGLVADFLPTITSVMDGITMLINGDENGLVKIKDGIGNFLGSIQEMLPSFMTTGLELINAFIQVIIDNLPQITQMGIELLTQLAVGIIKALPSLLAKVPEIIKTIVSGLLTALPEIVNAGVDLIKGLWQGISNAKSWLLNKISGFVSSVTSALKGFFGIHSPSKVMADEVGKFLPMGIAEGIEDNSKVVDDAMNGLMEDVTGSANANVMANINGNISSIGNSTTSDSNRLYQLLATYLPLIEQECGVTINADAAKIFSVVRDENKKFTDSTGFNPLMI